MINLTDNADIHLSSIINENTTTDIRLAVSSGGCSGFSYDWQLTSSEEAGDHIIDLDSGKLLMLNPCVGVEKVFKYRSKECLNFLNN